MENTRTVNSDGQKNLHDMSSQLTKVNKNYGEDWITIEEQDLLKLVLESFAEEDKRKILNSVVDKALPVSDILEMCNIPTTSAYRKINSLIKAGLLKTERFIGVGKSRKRTYRSLFENVRIRINKNKIIVKVKFTKK